jgi:hypothetical protein
MIISTRNLYDLGESESNDENQNSPAFWVSVGISCFFPLANMVILAFYTFKIRKSYSEQVTTNADKDYFYD